tara:strand:- start:1666 stop:2232 length:567 start_codon:yes stop_codon:yes gene_type:complete
MLEVELKALVTNLDDLIKKLQVFSSEPYVEINYEDIYFDQNNQLSKNEKELRLRKKYFPKKNESTFLLTYKDPPFDSFSRSKPEFETEIADLENGIAILEKLGYTISTEYEKHCKLFQVDYKNLHIEVTLATIPKLNQTFIEVESQTNQSTDTEQIFKILKNLLLDLGVNKNQWTNEYYIEAIKKLTD